MLFSTRIAIPLLTRTFSSAPSPKDGVAKAKLAIEQGKVKAAQASSSAVKKGEKELKQRKAQ
jgi:hypothetical protein